jgi:hypothetical protein
MIQLLITLVVLGVVWYLIETYVPIAEPFRTIIRIVLILFLCLWLLSTFGIIGGGLHGSLGVR